MSANSMDPCLARQRGFHTPSAISWPAPCIESRICSAMKLSRISSPSRRPSLPTWPL